ncbi:MAG: formate dehydrogenase accessory protein FdhE [Firmicutes bacterium]|jgi:FdhE protein|nr:formate dehydrogenase accessory protein FdhE [Bacillota bacterium]HPU01183.1 formate dehydrogenase accessory protein FdhE [Bacillota bacterium]
MEPKEKLNREIEIYLKEKQEAAPLFRLYADLFQLQERYAGQAKPHLSWSREQARELLLQGHYLLKGRSPGIDPVLFRKVLGEIVETVIRHFPRAEALRKIMRQPELAESELPRFLSRVDLRDSAALEGQLRRWGWKDDGAAGSSLAAYVLREALATFYLALAAAVREEVNLALWSEGNCPLCGLDPAMAMLNAEGARFLRCSFCRTTWPFPRLECPFCRNKDPQRLGFFYADEYPGRRVQFCERCKSYLKTAVVKEIGREVILELEDIYTLELDHLARREGYRPGRDLALLQE